MSDQPGEKGPPYYRPPMDPPEGYDSPDAINALRTEYDPQGDVTAGWLSTLVWNIRNNYLGIPGATFTAEQMRMVCEGFLTECARLRARADEAALRSIEASNPGIDMDEVRAHYFGSRDGSDV